MTTITSVSVLPRGWKDKQIPRESLIGGDFYAIKQNHSVSNKREQRHRFSFVARAFFQLVCRPLLLAAKS